MSYSEFLNTFLAPIQAFLGWASSLTTALINNYVFITFVGFSVITTLLYLFFDYFLNLGGSNTTKKRNLDNGGKK